MITAICTYSQYVVSFDFSQKKDSSRFEKQICCCWAIFKYMFSKPKKLDRKFNSLFFCSADDEGGRVISGYLEETILLPCPCSHNLDKEFTWQMDEPRTILVLKYTNNRSSFGDGYKGRAKMFLPEKRNNCSVMLANITANDQGKYRCSFYIQKRYIKEFVYLNVSGESFCI